MTVFDAIPVDHIDCDSDHPRRATAGRPAGTWLLASIEQYGVLQNLIVHRRADGRYRILDGQRRFHCAQELGLTTLPCSIHTGLDDGEAAVLRFQLQDTHKPWTQSERAVAKRRAPRRSRFPSP